MSDKRPPFTGPPQVMFGLWLHERRAELARVFVPLDKRPGGFVGIEELAEFTGLCIKTIRREVLDRALAVHRVRGRLIIAVSDALAWLSARKED